MSDTVHTVIELFSVELWREVFDYLNTNDLWYSFRGLNRRIDAIIDQTTTILHLNFKKRGSYRYFMIHILSSINVDNVQSLKFQDAKEIRHFFSKYSLNSLDQLRLLSLTSILSFNDNFFIFWRQLSSLKYLQFLKIMFWDNFGLNNCIEEKEFIIRSIFNRYFCPSLKSFVICTGGRQKWPPTIPSLITTTKTTNIKYLSIDSLTYNDLIKLLPALQNIKSFRIDYELHYDNESNEQLHQEMSITMPLMLQCIRLHLKLSDKITFECIEYLLKHAPNLKDLFLWGWYHLLNARKWELLLSMYCPKLIKFELICTGRIGDHDFDQAIHDFEQEYQTISFWLERNVTITDEVLSGHNYRYEAVVRFNIKKK
jgi:hypothetical protein